MDLAIRAENLGKCFRIYANKRDKLRGAFLKSDNRAIEAWAVRHLTLSLPTGTACGIIGPNGSGKTTLLQLIAGLLKPTEGSIEVYGTLATLLDLTSGLQPELSGRENIYVSGSLRGFSRRELNEKVDQIVAFSELENVIDQPIKHYSTGMLMRLAFATAISVEPKLLLIDEVFAVGDMAFQHKCIRKIRQLRKQGASIVLVSHDLTAIKSLCDQALLLHNGRELTSGDPETVTNRYLDVVAQKIAATERNDVQYVEGAGQISARYHRHGSGEGKVQAISIINSNGSEAESFRFGDEITFRFCLEYLADVPESGLGFYIRDRYGNDIIGINTFEEQAALGARKKGERIIVEFTLPIYLKPGSYSVSPGFAYDRQEPRYMDWIDNAAFFHIEPAPSGRLVHGFVHIPNRVRVQNVV